MSKIYKKGRGNRSALEKQMEREVQEIIDQNNIDISEIELPKTQDQLRDLRNSLQEQYVSPTSSEELKGESSAKTEEPTPSFKEESSGSEEEFESFEEPTENSDSDLPSTETNGEESWELSDFTEIENKHPFSQPFKQEDMFKASGFMEEEPGNPEPGGQVEEIDPTQDMERTSTEKPEEVQDSVEDPWARRRPSAPTGESTGAPEPSGSNNENLELSDEEKKKVKLAQSTGKKASEMLAKQVTNLTCSALEGGAKWYGKMPVTEKKLKKLEATGRIDRHFVVDPATQKTFNHIVEEHKEFLDEVIKVDADQKEDLMKAIMLVAEKHDVQVSPESNLMMVLLNIVITIGQASHQQKKKMERLISKVSDNYVMQSKRIAPLEDENAQLKEQLRVLQGGQSVAPSPSNEQNSTPGQPPRVVSFSPPGEKFIQELGSNDQKRTVETASNEIQTITSDVEGDSVPLKFKRIDLKEVKA